ncbi:unnamed protein product [Vitrella brassicaformis CCMP3155]|uniref:Pherophorin domain-containing protein n=2 Tax=Vitrella brassicaformis TaxID=1169539 RepID=A0A0G4EYD6_VITBC|nr:unnamed protein product [Vitrella brassicaformis CCMP3155]|eukprot:CEM03460.1 unnamed protein product [Vitrella brassicaformis CCMP3155]
MLVVLLLLVIAAASTLPALGASWRAAEEILLRIEAEHPQAHAVPREVEDMKARAHAPGAVTELAFHQPEDPTIDDLMTGAREAADYLGIATEDADHAADGTTAAQEHPMEAEKQAIEPKSDAASAVIDAVAYDEHEPDHTIPKPEAAYQPDLGAQLEQVGPPEEPLVEDMLPDEQPSEPVPEAPEDPEDLYGGIAHPQEGPPEHCDSRVWAHLGCNSTLTLTLTVSKMAKGHVTSECGSGQQGAFQGDDFNYWVRLSVPDKMPQARMVLESRTPSGVHILPFADHTPRISKLGMSNSCSGAGCEMGFRSSAFQQGNMHIDRVGTAGSYYAFVGYNFDWTVYNATTVFPSELHFCCFDPRWVPYDSLTSCQNMLV